MQRKLLLFVVIIGISGIGSAIWLDIWYASQPERVLAPTFTLTDLSQQTVNLNDFRGNVTILDFLATWCSDCKAQLSTIVDVQENYGTNVAYLFIFSDLRESDDTLRDFASQYPYPNWIWARDPANLFEVYSVTTIPKTIIIDREGFITYTHVGVSDPITLFQKLDSLIR
jgi:cytochrome c-type biogenesis protein